MLNFNYFPEIIAASHLYLLFYDCGDKKKMP